MTKTKKIITWVLAGLLALAFLNAGISKLIGAEMQIKNFESWGYPLWFRFPVGLIEIVLAIGILVPKFRKLTVYGIFVWAAVAIITHLQAAQATMAIAPALFGVIAAIILRLQRESNNQISLS